MAHFWPIPCVGAIRQIIYYNRLEHEQEKRLLGILMNAFARSESRAHLELELREMQPEHEAEEEEESANSSPNENVHMFLLNMLLDSTARRIMRVRG